MQANTTIDTAEKASQKAVESTMLSPRFYTTDFAAIFLTNPKVERIAQNSCSNEQAEHNKQIELCQFVVNLYPRAKRTRRKKQGVAGQ